MGQVDAGNNLTRVGITCALCHSTVDNSFLPGIGKRLDGWPNRDLDVGAIIALSDKLPDAPYNTWGPGMYDPRFSLDGKNGPVVLPPAFGLRHVSKEVYTGDGPVSYWNRYVAVTQMHGHGRFVDARIGVSVDNTPPDLVSSKLDALRAYQLSLETPEARPGTYDLAASRRGKEIFFGQNPPQLDGPYFHDGSAATLEEVVDHYVNVLGLQLTTRQKADLVEFLKTL
jgi:hypothetical protein